MKMSRKKDLSQNPSHNRKVVKSLLVLHISMILVLS